MQRDLYNNAEPVQSLAPAARTDGTVNGTGVDLQGFASAMAIIALGGWTDGTHSFELQESDDNSDYSAVADADLQGTEPVMDAGDEDLVVHRIGYQGSKRYIRVSVTVASSETGAVYGASILRGHPTYAPI